MASCLLQGVVSRKIHSSAGYLQRTGTKTATRQKGDAIMMKLYWSPRSRSFSALWLMEEAGEPYERVLTDISKGAQKTAEYLAVNPMGKVPAIQDGETTLAEAAG